MSKQHNILIKTDEAILLRAPNYTAAELAWAKSMAMCYGARPLKSDGNCFYHFIVDVFNAGRISGKREERSRRSRT